jgi:phage gpG-like protein
MANQNTYKFDLKIKNFKQGKPSLMRAISVLAADQFRLNFRKQGFMDTSLKPWTARKFEFPGKKRSILTGIAGGALRDSITSTFTANKAVVSTNKAYARIHNEGGIVPVTPKMRAFFWAMYYKTKAKASTAEHSSIKTRKTIAARSSLSKAAKLAPEANIWRNLAMKKGNTITIPKRQFMGHSKDLEKKIDRLVKNYMKKL